MKPSCLKTISAAALLGLSACGKKQEPVSVAKPAAPRAPVPSAKTLFARVMPETSGVAFVNPIDNSHPMRRLYYSGYVCGGVAVGDVDKDGWLDLFFANGPRANALYRQRAPWNFEDVTASAGLAGGDLWGTGAAFADVDADGDLDLYLCHYQAPNALFLNDGQGKFREAAKAFGVDLVDASLMPSFCDYDRDGDLDLFVLTNRYYRAGGRPSAPPYEVTNGKAVVKPEYAEYYGLIQTGPTSYDMDEVGRPDYLFRNEGKDASGQVRFVDVTARSGISGPGHGLSSVWCDFNEDGWMDLYVANDFVDPDRLYQNNGDGTFRDALPERVNYTPWFSMGSDVGDVNNDGHLDLAVLDMAATTHYRAKVGMGQMGKFQYAVERHQPRQVMRNVLYLNAGPAGAFIECAFAAGVAKSNWSWAAKLADYDGDGWVDLFISNGIARDFNHSDIPLDKSQLIGRSEWDYYADRPPHPEKNMAYRNLGEARFEDAGAAWGVDQLAMSYAAAHGDLDNDGDLDLIVANLDEPASLLRNQSSERGGHWLKLRLRGDAANPGALGARVTLTTERGVQVRQLMPSTGFLSTNAPELCFGLGAADVAKEITIEWPGQRTVQKLTNVKANQVLEVAREAGQPSTAPAFQPLLVASDRIQGQHRERVFDDFARQSLLPNKLSQLGPSLAWGDVDGDGDEDFFLGQGFGSPSEIHFQDQGKWTARPLDLADVEAMGAVFLDADNDGDLDLYVASGSYEFDQGAAALRDRLLINDGKGKFTEAPAGAIPDDRESDGPVAAADFDRDGDVDLFVGARVVPGEYPVTPRSRLLENVSEGSAIRFVEATEELAPDLYSTGLVTAALWSDADNDGWLDLLVAHEWGAVKVYQNHQGKLADRTQEAGLAEWLGWWNSLAAVDVDGDGDMDYVAGNQGLNSKYHATKEKPTMIYYGDYAGDGKRNIVEAEYEHDALFPVRGRSCSSRAMPHLREKFTSFDQFAKATLTEIYSPESLQQSVKLEADTLASGVFRNDGQGRFRFEPLPHLAQSAPIFGVVAADVTGDGLLDLICGQNFGQPQFETGPNSGGLSLVLQGDGNGGFQPLWPMDSGLGVLLDARCLTTADLNGDGSLDLLIATNNGPLLAYESRRPSAKLTITPASPGARVEIAADGKTLAHEIHAGAGYQSQSSPALPLPDSAKSIRVRWPDGVTAEVKVETPGRSMTIAKPRK